MKCINGENNARRTVKNKYKILFNIIFLKFNEQNKKIDNMLNLEDDV